MIAENIVFLQQNYPHIMKDIKNKQVVGRLDCQLIETKTGISTLQVVKEQRNMLVHSKYDPIKEAERLIEQYSDNIDNFEHVLFYGVGLGYHIDVFMSRFPKFNFSLYEPSNEIFQMYLNEQKLSQLPLQNLRNIFIEHSQEDGKRFIDQFAHNITERILLVVLPSYQQIFKEEFRYFSDYFKGAIESKRILNNVDHAFSLRWTLNSLLNFPKTIQTPNILSEEFKSHFRDKPLIIVSAGPSLEEEYENLKYIKENKLAYIFAVGSANRALVAQNIMPDAVCTYDPQGHNHQVFASMIEEGITTVPMIYGTSVGFETLNMYQGPKLHMVTNQDTVAQYYLKNTDESSIDVINDAPTIAAVTFQLAAKLGCSPIIFAGQNLAFKNDQYYSKDVEYKHKNRSIEVKDEDRQEIVYTDDLFGNKVETTPSFNKMREYIEFQINEFKGLEVINTTKGGAAIQGTVFKPLEELIEEKLTKAVVEQNWYRGIESKYDKKYILERMNQMERSIESFRKHYWKMQSILQDIMKNIVEKKEKKLGLLTIKFDKLMNRITDNECYINYIQPINRVQLQALTIQAAAIRKQSNEIDRAKLIIAAFVPFLEKCKQTLEEIAGSIYKMHIELNNTLLSKRFYSCNSAVFRYGGKWEKEDYSVGESIDYPVEQLVMINKSTISFRFTGTSLRILGSKRKDCSNRIQILIDGHSQQISARRTNGYTSETPNINEVLFEKEKLVDKEHYVEIKVLDNNSFMFTGIEIDEARRVLHVDEVTSIEEIENGKKIRCHYKATHNTVGEFSGLGEETSQFIPPESSMNPDGDFYFILVDETEEGKKLIADRSIQNYISFHTLKEKLLNNNHKIKLDGYGYITLPSMGRYPGDKANDWYKYIESKKVPNEKEYWNFIDLMINFGSDIPDGYPEKGVFRGKYHNGKGRVFGDNAHNWFLISGIEGAYSVYGFRPMLVGEKL